MVDEDGGQADDGQADGNDVVIVGGTEVQRDSGVFLSMQRNQNQ